MGGAARLARMAVLVALAVALSYVERLLPMPAPVPGVKLGLANLVVVVALYWFGWREALAISAVRVLMAAALFGSGFSAVYGLCGAVCALGAMAAARRAGLHVVVVSAMGGAAHNLAQLGVAAWAVGTAEVAYYAPVLAAVGVGTGILVGAASQILIRRLPRPS